MRAWLLAALLLAVLLLPGPAAACAGPRRAEVPVQVRDGFPFVPGTVAGQPVTLLLDTGSEGMAVTPEAVRALSLPLLPGATARVLGTGGAHDALVARLQGVRVGGAPVRDRDAPVLALPGLPAVVPPVAGLLGAPLLAAYEVELDGPGGRMALHEPQGCPGPPWPGAVLRLHVTAAGERLLPVTVNGQALLALLDTGSRGTILTEAAAARLGLRAPVAASTARGVDGQRMELRYAAVRELRVGGDVARELPVIIAPVQVGGADLLLGMDWAGRRKLWVSYGGGWVAVAQ